MTYLLCLLVSSTLTWSFIVATFGTIKIILFDTTEVLKPIFVVKFLLFEQRKKITKTAQDTKT